MSQRARRAPLQIPPHPMSDFVHRALRFGEERKDRVDVDGILDEAQRHIDTSLLRVLVQPDSIAEQYLALRGRDEKRRQAGEIAEQWRHQGIRRLVALEIRCPHESQEVAVCGGGLSREWTHRPPPPETGGGWGGPDGTRRAMVTRPA